MMDSDKRMIKAQGELITKLHITISEQQNEYNKLLYQYNKVNDYYMMIQNSVKNNEIVAEKFKDLIATIKLIEDETPGLTKSEFQ